MKRDRFTFYRSYYEAIVRLKTKKEQVEAFEAICRYALYNEKPNEGLSKNVKKAISSISHQIELDIRQTTEGRRCLEYKNWRKLIYERDDFTCQKCRAHGVRLNAHHIKPYAIYPELRYELSNGITLCERCHKEEHRRRL